MATQVALLGNVPEPFDSVKGLVKWQEAHRRKLLQSKPLNPPHLFSGPAFASDFGRSVPQTSRYHAAVPKCKWMLCSKLTQKVY